MAQYGSVKVDAPAWNEGKSSSVALRKLNLLRGLLIRITGTLNITGGTGAGTYHTDAVHRLLRNVRVRANNFDVLNITGQTLGKLDKVFGSQPLEQTFPTLQAAGGAYPIDYQMVIPFYMVRSHTPDDHALPTEGAGSPTLICDFGAADDFAYGTDSTKRTLTGMSVELYEIPLQGAPTSPQLYPPMLLDTYDKVLNASGANQKVALDKLLPGWELRAAIIETFDNGAGGNGYRYSNAIADNIALNVNNEYVFDRTAEGIIRNRNKSTYGLATREVGFYAIDAAENKYTRRGELWTVRGNVQPYVQFDGTKSGAGDTLVRVTTIATMGRVSP